MRAKVNSIGLGGVTNLAVLARIKPGFVAGFESITYLERLRKLLKALQSARQNQVESELRAPVFPDSIGRFGIIHAFRYALVEPRPGLAGSRASDSWLLSLNVSFDGGWEPYMRVIYRDLGPLLDALFCHCEGYPGSTAPFDDYCRWVRDNELDGGLFYTESATSLADRRYLAEVERLQRETPHPERADEAIARYAVAPERRQVAAAFAEVMADPRATLALPVRALKGLYRLSIYFPPDTPDGGVLIRFARSLLKEFLLVVASDAFVHSPTGALLGKELADEFGWLKTPQPRKVPKDRLTYTPAALQAMIVERDDTITHGCVALLGVGNANDAVVHLAGMAKDCGPAATADAIRHHVAFTHAGLQALGIAAERLDRLPQEFVEGMEARCGLLGDVRGNHPDHWRRPLRRHAGTADDRVDLTAVHVVVVLRLADAAAGGVGLHPRLEQALVGLHAAGSGLTLLAVQPMRSARAAAGAAPRGHFGFVDGLSQPRAVPGQPAPRSDEVRAGELLLGYCNDRGDAPFPEKEDRLLDNGSFLVMRKLRQRVDHLAAALDAHPARDEVLARMMGRRQDGTPLVAAAPGGDPNAFNYDRDPAGEACPFASHVRRANPRDGREPMPRILRRGMSYGPTLAEAGPAAERGIVFMAYCASIAEQFETVQRWIAGGNSSGVSSSQADPFLAVPKAGEKRTFRYIDAAGKVARVDLGARPFVELEWGLYLFVPSLQALAGLACFREPPPAPTAPKDKAHDAEPQPPTWYWRRRLEDPDRSAATWSEVRAEPDARMKAPSYGTLVGGAAQVLSVLQDPGTSHSVQGYGQRMDASVGVNHLGIDHRMHAVSAWHADIVNAEIEAIDAREAFREAVPIVRKVLDEFGRLAQPHPDGRMRMPVDLVALSERVLARLCTAWVGLPEVRAALPQGEQPFMVEGGRIDAGCDPPPRCPGQISAASRLIFSPHPVVAAQAAGRKDGPPILAAVRSFMQSGRPRGRLARAIASGLAAADATADYTERAIAGLLLGFPPTVHGNFLRTMETWIDKDRSLWRHQQRLAELPLVAGADGFERAAEALRQPLLDTMRQRPVPEMLWRCPVVDGKVVTDSQRQVVLGIASAMADGGAHELMFGGARQGELKTPHACPGYGMGLGVMLALIGELLDAGTLRPTGSPVLLMLTPRLR